MMLLKNEIPQMDKIGFIGYRYLIKNLTGMSYSVSFSSRRQWGKDSQVETGTFIELIPEGNDGGFYHWYCAERKYFQLFKTTGEAVDFLLFYWILWKKKFFSED